MNSEIISSGLTMYATEVPEGGGEEQEIIEKI